MSNGRDNGYICFMNPDELFKIITSEPKWYAGYIKHSTASMIKRRYKNGTLSKERMYHIFKYFGFKVIQEEKWGIN